ncbi:hypothetical protein GWK47_038150 [Chionoecetes opilio]|uniref:Uncharacterized protein n=1 Tax=Chionoecetes opilio TaxID=41210 RepID=A0A8J5CYT0_CHIOP|nr:hypothetical protein GWK47_038150 [Chionoecetes opilio]
MTATPRSRTCLLGLCSYGWSGVSGALSPPSPSVPPGLSAWMSSVNPFMARMEGHLTSGSHSPTPRRRRSPSPASLSPVPPSESVVVGMTTWCAPTGKEDAALPVPKRRRFGDFPPLASCPPGPYSAFSSEMPSRCTSPRPAAEDALDSSFFLRPVYLGTDGHLSIACETVDGRLVAIGRLEDGSWGQFRTWRCVAPGWTGDRSPSSTAGFLSLA